ncbi:hypothetical protein ZIOFF_069169 [Zingiber officinale]|uniref:Uncharacterized protein n=1 Tax=Zingiber officinale TaxID=94328 RepID=A0A8J5C5L4_ZINOF|nr:hypothetical protein ZIOFF_069169 [Zingiber officinale]
MSSFQKTMGRAPCSDKAIVKKGHWSPEEDKQLKEYIEKHGNGGNWISLPRKAGLKRCGKSCRLRWLNYLRPNIKHGSFSDTEDMIITNLYTIIGSRSLSCYYLNHVTDNEIKNYWNTNLKKKFSGIQITPTKRRIMQQKQQDYSFPSSLDALNHLILSVPGIESLPIAACLVSSLTSTDSGSTGSGSAATVTVEPPLLLQCAEEQTCNYVNFGASCNLSCLSSHSDGSASQSFGIGDEAWGGASSLLGQKCELMPVVAAAAGSIDLCFDGYGGAREAADQVSMYYY